MRHSKSPGSQGEEGGEEKTGERGRGGGGKERGSRIGGSAGGWVGGCVVHHTQVCVCVVGFGGGGGGVQGTLWQMVCRRARPSWCGHASIRRRGQLPRRAQVRACVQGRGGAPRCAARAPPACAVSPVVRHSRVSPKGGERSLLQAEGGGGRGGGGEKERKGGIKRQITQQRVPPGICPGRIPPPLLPLLPPPCLGRGLGSLLGRGLLGSRLSGLLGGSGLRQGGKGRVSWLPSTTGRKRRQPQLAPCLQEAPFPHHTSQAEPTFFVADSGLGAAFCAKGGEGHRAGGQGAGRAPLPGYPADLFCACPSHPPLSV